ncbi:sporulation and cell division protein SsgA [Kitasatospora sp. SolWspMP-SS2h]|uniref:SsgA family sporulation/cell division regulator n=1 Tax=Kitasatospora sp. SolWspMP-SS2h TaxID=1305729 RepID=UPI000DC026A3|nr:SsgA family sporulation/cell division regulator [Kitasatospora sp. SolWspMP-SS2h]RAJ45499.1 sporulation and cell division protein SsgA [Kitasatospora sp. SolWspMP-SS2h]
MSAAVSRPISVTLPESPYPHVPVTGQLRFDPALPYGVGLAFPPQHPGDEDVVWWFGRELLAEGRRAPSGEGDVRIAPGVDGRVLITLGARGERALISIPADTVAAFLVDTFAEVPPGTESAHLDLDLGLARLLA